MSEHDARSSFANQDSYEMNEILYSREAEIESFNDLEVQKGTPIPALFTYFHKYVQNPSSVSLETFKRMIDTDDTIGSGVDFLTTCLAARLGAYTHPNEEVSKWMNKRLAEIEGGWFNCVKELLSASWAGFAVQEKVWQNKEHGFSIKKLVTLPPTTILFETERTGELTHDGILQYQRGYIPGTLLASSSSAMFGLGFSIGTQPDINAKFGDLPFPMRTSNPVSFMSIRIPKVKCVHYAFDAQGKFGNPYGRSLLRRCYKYYVMKDAFLKMLAVALDRKGTPLTIVYADPNTTLKDSSKTTAQGNVKGTSVGITADKAAHAAFSNIHNDSTIILPGMKGKIFDTDFAPQDSNADQFLAALDFCNRSIMRGLLIPSLIFTNGDGNGSFALGQEHAKTFEKILDGMLEGLKQVLLEQVIREMICYNFPASIWKKDGFGEFSKREFSQEELDKIMQMFEKGIQNGIINSNDLDDLNKMRDTIGFEPCEKLFTAMAPAGFAEGGNPLDNPTDTNEEDLNKENKDGNASNGQDNGGNKPVDKNGSPKPSGDNPRTKAEDTNGND